MSSSDAVKHSGSVHRGPASLPIESALLRVGGLNKLAEERGLGGHTAGICMLLHH